MFQYETYLAEYLILIADIEVGLMNWNKFRLAAFRVKRIEEMRHYLMYLQLATIKYKPVQTKAIGYKYEYPPIEEDRFRQLKKVRDIPANAGTNPPMTATPGSK